MTPVMRAKKAVMELRVLSHGPDLNSNPKLVIALEP